MVVVADPGRRVSWVPGPTVKGRSTGPLGHTLPSRAMTASPIRSGYSTDGQ
jgi:hypothetical protein